MPVFIDALLRKVDIHVLPQRIISLVPSITELLFDLGLDQRIAGITKYCIHPENRIQSKIIIGGTENLETGLIDEINPDLIIAGREENNREEISRLMDKYPVYVCDVKGYDDALHMIIEIGEITGCTKQSARIVNDIADAFASLPPVLKHRKAIYLIWKKPWMTVNKDTFINQMLFRAGFDNAFRNKTTRYPVISDEDIIGASPEIIFLSSEPYPFKEKDIMEFKLYAPDAKVRIVDGEMSSWYGSHMIKAPAYFRQLY
ncbi:MAG: helical backbone metal receptor [Bacteroidota bacterium]